MATDYFARDFSDSVQSPYPTSYLPGDLMTGGDISTKEKLAKRALEQLKAADVEGAGIKQGARKVLSSIQNLTGHPTLGGILPSAAENSSAEQQFNKLYGNNPLAQSGVSEGEFAGVTPLMIAGGEALGGVGGLLSRAAPQVAPAVDFLSGNAAGNKLVQLASKGTAGYEQGAATNALIGEDPNEGGKVGAFLNTVLPGGALLSNSIKNTVSGGGVRPEIAQLAKMAEDKYGVSIPNAQISSSPAVKWIDSILPSIPFSGHGGELAKATSDITRAVSHTFGADSSSLTRDVMEEAHQNLSNKFNELAAKTPNIPLNDNVLNKLSSIHNDANEALGSDAKKITKQIDKIIGLTKEGALSGDSFNALMRANTPLDRLSKNIDPNISYYARNIKDALYDGLTDAAPPDLVKELNNTKMQWKNFKTIEDSAKASGVTGEINPSALFRATEKTAKKYGDQGLEDLQNISKIGKFLKPLPMSGSPERGAAMGLLNSLGSAAGGATGAFVNGTPGAAIGALAAPAATSAAGRVASSVINSNWYRNKLLQAAQESGNPLINGVGNPARSFIGNNYIPAALLYHNRLLASPEVNQSQEAQ